MNAKIATTIITMMIGWGVIACAPAAQGPPLQIPSPVFSYRSPALDFTKAKGLCVMPLTPGEVDLNVAALGGTEMMRLGAIVDVKQDDEFQRQAASLLEAAIPQYLKAQYRDWHILGPQELFRVINENNLNRGFQYFVADMGGKVSASEIVPVSFSKETMQFFDSLSKFAQCDLFLFVNYVTYITHTLEEPDVVRLDRYLSLRSMLFYPKGGDRPTWWTSHIKIHGFYKRNYGSLQSQITGSILGPKGKPIPVEQLVDLAAQSLSQNLGKGSLRNL